MAAVKAVFDTNIVIDALNGVPASETEYLRYEQVLISRITWIEVLVGAVEGDTAVRDFLETRFVVSPIDERVADEAVLLRRRHRVRVPDAIIWATARVYEAVLVTRNTRDFPAKHANVRVPYRL